MVGYNYLHGKGFLIIRFCKQRQTKSAHWKENLDKFTCTTWTINTANFRGAVFPPPLQILRRPNVITQTSQIKLIKRWRS